MSDYLFARPSLLSGAARTLDLGGEFDHYNYSESGDIADALAAFLDVQAVGFDLAESVREALREIHRERELEASG